MLYSDMSSLQKLFVKAFAISCMIFFIIAFFPNLFFNILGKEITNMIGGIALFFLIISFGGFFLAFNNK
tara:strand:+ start:19 stop:225 length:207 start_codon:yes stop_codon:yes gene_type:complete